MTAPGTTGRVGGDSTRHVVPLGTVRGAAVQAIAERSDAGLLTFYIEYPCFCSFCVAGGIVTHSIQRTAKLSLVERTPIEATTIVTVGCQSHGWGTWRSMDGFRIFADRFTIRDSSVQNDVKEAILPQWESLMRAVEHTVRTGDLYQFSLLRREPVPPAIPAEPRALAFDTDPLPPASGESRIRIGILNAPNGTRGELFAVASRHGDGQLSFTLQYPTMTGCNCRQCTRADAAGYSLQNMVGYRLRTNASEALRDDSLLTAGCQTHPLRFWRERGIEMLLRNFGFVAASEIQFRTLLTPVWPALIDAVVRTTRSGNVDDFGLVVTPVAEHAPEQVAPAQQTPTPPHAASEMGVYATGSSQQRHVSNLQQEEGPSPRTLLAQFVAGLRRLRMSGNAEITHDDERHNVSYRPRAFVETTSTTEPNDR